MPQIPADSATTLTTTAVLQRLHLSESSRYGWLRRAIRDGKFPPPDYPQQGRGKENRWLLSTISAWEKTRSLGSKQPGLDFDALEQLEAEAVLCWAAVCAIVDRSSWTLKRWIRLGLFPEPDVEKLSIIQIAARFHVSVSQVRAWEIKGVVCPDREKAGVPMYGAMQLRQINQIALRKAYDKAPIQTSHRFTAGYFWTSETLTEWANQKDCWGKIEQLNRSEILRKLQTKS